MKKVYYLVATAVIFCCFLLIYSDTSIYRPHICYLELHGVTRDDEMFYTKFPMKHYVLKCTDKVLQLKDESAGIITTWNRGPPVSGSVAIEYNEIWYCCTDVVIINERDFIQPYSPENRPKLFVMFNDAFMHIPVFYSSSR